MNSLARDLKADRGTKLPRRPGNLRRRAFARWMDAYTLAAFNPVHPYRRPIDRI